MAREKKTETKRPIKSYEHRDKRRVNNPPVGLVTPDTDPDAGAKKAYTYDPHLDSQLQWAGKAKHASFEVPTVSLHVHERIEPRTIIEAVRKRNGNSNGPFPLFASLEENPPLRQTVEFYQHAHGWSNRLVAGDSLLVRSGQKQQGGIPPVSWNSARIVSGAGDIVGDLKEFGISEFDECRRVIERLQRDQQVVGRLETLAQNLNFPVRSVTKNRQLKTQNLHCIAVHGWRRTSRPRLTRNGSRRTGARCPFPSRRASTSGSPSRSWTTAVLKV